MFLALWPKAISRPIAVLACSVALLVVNLCVVVRRNRGMLNLAFSSMLCCCDCSQFNNFNSSGIFKYAQCISVSSSVLFDLYMVLMVLLTLCLPTTCRSTSLWLATWWRGDSSLVLITHQDGVNIVGTVLVPDLYPNSGSKCAPFTSPLEYLFAAFVE